MSLRPRSSATTCLMICVAHSPATCDKTVNEVGFAYGAHVCEVEIDPLSGSR